MASDPMLTQAKRIALALERIAEALESANELDPMQLLADALVDEGDHLPDTILLTQEEKELSVQEFVARMS